eukprot:scaffold5096_cov169-Amphora_coffeaeformis.AAC.13
MPGGRPRLTITDEEKSKRHKEQREEFRERKRSLSWLRERKGRILAMNDMENDDASVPATGLRAATRDGGRLELNEYGTENGAALATVPGRHGATRDAGRLESVETRLEWFERLLPRAMQSANTLVVHTGETNYDYRYGRTTNTVNNNTISGDLTQNNGTCGFTEEDRAKLSNGFTEEDRAKLINIEVATARKRKRDHQSTPPRRMQPANPQMTRHNRTPSTTPMQQANCKNDSPEAVTHRNNRAGLFPSDESAATVDYRKLAPTSTAGSLLDKLRAKLHLFAGDGTPATTSELGFLDSNQFVSSFPHLLAEPCNLLYLFVDGTDKFRNGAVLHAIVSNKPPDFPDTGLKSFGLQWTHILPGSTQLDPSIAYRISGLVAMKKGRIRASKAGIEKAEKKLIAKLVAQSSMATFLPYSE